MSHRNIPDLAPEIRELHDRFVAAGYELWLVGGCVRDTLLGLTPKDIDLTTSATPDEQIALYEQHGYSYVATGLAHGTITVVIDHIPYEITTYRIDRETDGRHAVVEYTRDLRDDLRRRDLTINAIAMGFDGTIFDPHGGAADAEAGVVRFVGDADERLREDYLRALRWFRFYGRFGNISGDRDAIQAIVRAAPYLRRISVERIWAEVSKIITGRNADQVLELIHLTGVAHVIGLPDGDRLALNQARLTSRNPAALMAVYGGEAVLALGQRWKWSKIEQKTASFIIEQHDTPYGVSEAKRDIVMGVGTEVVTTLLAVRGEEEARYLIETWKVPAFPVSGNDLIERGITGPDIGRWMKDARRRWIESDYTLGKTDMLTV